MKLEIYKDDKNYKEMYISYYCNIIKKCIIDINV